MKDTYVIHYQVTTPDAGSAVFLAMAPCAGRSSDCLKNAVWVLKNAVPAGKFQIRMPGQTEGNSYLEWSGPKQ